ncbi:MAG: hypothetical protein ACOYK8_05205 [Alphaproteobacteria bacterium]
MQDTHLPALYQANNLCAEQNNNEVFPEFLKVFQLAVTGGYIPKEVPEEFANPSRLWFRKNTESPLLTAMDLLTAVAIKIIADEKPQNLEDFLQLRDDAFNAMLQILSGAYPEDISLNTSVAFFQALPLQTLGEWLKNDPELKPEDEYFLALSVMNRITPPQQTSNIATSLASNNAKWDRISDSFSPEDTIELILSAHKVVDLHFQQPIVTPAQETFLSLRYPGQEMDALRTKLQALQYQEAGKPAAEQEVKISGNGAQTTMKIKDLTINFNGVSPPQVISGDKNVKGTQIGTQHNYYGKPTL